MKKLNNCCVCNPELLKTHIGPGACYFLCHKHDFTDLEHARNAMSGECEDCGEHVTDCRCVEGKLRDEVDMLQDTVMTHSYKLAQVFEFINNPAFEDYKRQLDVLRSKLDNTNSSINEIIHKCEDNMRRLNHMMLEMKGVISQASAKAKLFVPKNDIPQKD